jgi:hypothetical protein
MNIMDINNPPLEIQGMYGFVPSEWKELWMTYCLNKIKVLRSDAKTHFNDGGIPFTPEALMKAIQREMYIKRDHNILVMYTIEWAIWLKCNGFTNVSFATGYYKETMEDGIKVVEDEEGIDFRLEDICKPNDIKYLTLRSWRLERMKFDVVVGNPPYQDPVNPDSSKKLWPFFVDKAFELVKPNGYVGMITPSSWMNGRMNVFEHFKEKQCVYLDYDASKYFPGIGSTFSFYVIKNCIRTSPTNVKNEFEIDPVSMKYLPLDTNKISISIVEKIKGVETFVGISDSFCHASRKDKVSVIKNEEFQYPNKHGSETIVYSNIKHPCSDLKKVMFYMSGPMYPFYDDGEYGVTQHHGYIQVENEEQGLNLCSYLESKFIKYLLKQTVRHQAWDVPFIRDGIPAVPLTQKWPDEEIYRMFDLSPEQISYIESMVK